MRIWQADFYRRPWQDAAGQGLWELLRMRLAHLSIKQYVLKCCYQWPG